MTSPPVDGTATTSRTRAGGSRREATRGRLLRAADKLFRERGFPATTVSDIAARAEVSLQTLYLAWGSKGALFRAAAQATATGSTTPLDDQEWRRQLHDRLHAEAGSTAHAATYLDAVSRIFTEVAARSAVYWRMRPVAAAIDPEVNTGHEDLMRQRRITMEGIARSIPRAGLRDDLSPGFVADTLWALASPEMFSLFTTQAGTSAEGFQRWLTTALVATLCDHIDDVEQQRCARPDHDQDL